MNHFIFDFDGTIVDNVDFILKVVKDELDWRHISLMKSFDELRQMGGASALTTDCSNAPLSTIFQTCSNS